jgi:hypothetical protein
MDGTTTGEDGSFGQVLLKTRDRVTVEGIQTHRMVLEEFKKDQRLSQVHLAQEEEQLASESELIVKEEVNEYIRLMEESDQEVEELMRELLSTEKQVDNL